MKIKVISFDFGGTLAYETEEEHVVLLRALRNLGLSFEEDKIKQAYEKERRKYERYQNKEVWTEESHIKFVTNILQHLGVEDPMRYAERICKLYSDILDIRKFEDVDDILNTLTEEGYRLIVISNIASESRLRNYMKRLELLGFFEYLVASGSVGYEKPDSRIFLHACNLVNVKPQELMHIGDSYEHDYKGAENVGAFPVLIDRNNNYNSLECRKVSDLRKIVAFLQEAF